MWQNCPIIVHGKAPQPLHLFTPQGALFTPNKADVKRASSGVSWQGNGGAFPHTTMGQFCSTCHSNITSHVPALGGLFKEINNTKSMSSYSGAPKNVRQESWTNSIIVYFSPVLENYFRCTELPHLQRCLVLAFRET